MHKRLKENPNWHALRDRALVPAGARARQWRDWVRENDPVYTSFRRPGRPEKIAATVTLALIAVVVVFLMLFDWNWLRGPIGRWASAKYDRQIELNGDLDVNLFSWTPSARVRDLRIGGPDWARQRDTVQVEDLQLAVRLRALMMGRLEMPRVAITRPELVLISTTDGRKSWELDPDKPDDGEGMRLPPINRLIITEGKVSLDEQNRKIKLEATITAREGSDVDAGFHLDGRGTINRTPLTLTVRGGPFINIKRDRPYEFTAEVAGVGSRLRADGKINRPFDLRRFDADLSLQGRDLADLYLLTGITTPNTPPYRLRGKLTRNRSLFTLNDLNGRVGSSDLSGDLRINKVDGRRRVDGELRSRLLDLDDLAAVLGGAPRVAGGDTVLTSGAPGRLLPDAPLDVTRLRVMDGTIRYKAGAVKRNALEVRRVDLGADLKSGVLNLDPVAFTFSRGELNGTARIDARKAVPYSAVDFRLRGYPLESIIPARGGVPTVTGRALGRAKLEGSGASVRDFAAGSKGTMSLIVPQGRMRSAFAELLGINATAGLFKLLNDDDSTAEIRCAVANFDVRGGTATSTTFVIDTTPVFAHGSGTIDLGAETMNLRIDGEPKEARLVSLWSPILVSGPLTKPKVGIEGGPVAAQAGLAVGLAALVHPLAALLPFVDPGLAEDANCGALISNTR
ncbi:AsmA family protein [Brevundimonas sp. Root1279]|uniref:AsmA family protein n=1 Tax=Brevundimonas sp. Root1279 TaxID=1736443 RepID=UPI0009E96AE0|nr:AsmA family protein [Brevundimonas sp. Root1279]